MSAASSARHRRLPGLSLRGWVLLFSGLVLVGVGQYFVLGDITRLGVLLLVLPLLAWLLGATAVRLAHAEVDAGAPAPAGEPVEVEVRTRSSAALPQPPTTALVPLHATWGDAWELGTVTWDAEQRVHRRRVVPRARGRYEVGPLLVDRSDPLGLTRQALMAVGEAATATVLPTTVEYPGSRIHRMVQEAARRRVTPHPAEALDASSVREFTRGDDVRRIHWRSTARTGEIMVRHDDTAPTPWLLVCVDEAADWGASPSTDGPYPGPVALEAALQVAASLVRAAHRSGLEVRLLTAGGMEEGRHLRARTLQEDLEHLATLAPRSTRAQGFADAALRADRTGGVAVLVTAGSGADDVGPLGGRHPHHPGTALLVDRSGEGAGQGEGSAEHALRRGSWRVVTWTPDAGAPDDTGGTAPVPDAEVQRVLDLVTRTTARGEKR